MNKCDYCKEEFDEDETEMFEHNGKVCCEDCFRELMENIRDEAELRRFDRPEV